MAAKMGENSRSNTRAKQPACSRIKTVIKIDRFSPDCRCKKALQSCGSHGIPWQDLIQSE